MLVRKGLGREQGRWARDSRGHAGGHLGVCVGAEVEDEIEAWRGGGGFWTEALRGGKGGSRPEPSSEIDLLRETKELFGE